MASAPGERSSAAETRSWTHASETTRHTSKLYSPDGRQGRRDNVGRQTLKFACFGFGNSPQVAGDRGVRNALEVILANPSCSRSSHSRRLQMRQAQSMAQTGTEAPAHDVTSHASLNNTFARRQNKLESTSATLAPELLITQLRSCSSQLRSCSSQLRGCSQPLFLKTAFTTSPHVPPPSTPPCAPPTPALPPP
jgi:hypothetical protein